MMTRIAAAALLLALGAAEAGAQSRGAIEREERRIERRIDPNRPPVGSFVSPDNPDGVVGFDGPPDPMDDGVDQGGPLPPGSPADIDND